MDTIKTILESSNYSYEFIYHNQPILTAQEGANYFGIDTGQTAPTLIIKTDIGFFTLIISGKHGLVQLEQISFILGCKKVSMASKEEIKKKTGFAVGSLPLIGIPLPHILDKQLFCYPHIYGGSGQLNRTLKITPLALKQLNVIVAIAANFSK
jgi:Cys-tRNA(Pro)/Cys-tRNA(Cys) deacylase